jgi:hypothetical protein
MIGIGFRRLSRAQCPGDSAFAKSAAGKTLTTLRLDGARRMEKRLALALAVPLLVSSLTAQAALTVHARATACAQRTER